MSLNKQELEMVDNFTFSYQETYRRIAKFYKQHLNDWRNLSPQEKAKRLAPRGYDVMQSATFIDNLPDNSEDIFFILKIARLIRSSQKKDEMLEFAYHFEDEYGIKMGMYAEYLLEHFKIIKSFV